MVEVTPNKHTNEKSSCIEGTTLRRNGQQAGSGVGLGSKIPRGGAAPSPERQVLSVLLVVLFAPTTRRNTLSPNSLSPTLCCAHPVEEGNWYISEQVSDHSLRNNRHLDYDVFHGIVLVDHDAWRVFQALYSFVTLLLALLVVAGSSTRALWLQQCSTATFVLGRCRYARRNFEILKHPVHREYRSRQPFVSFSFCVSKQVRRQLFSEEAEAKPLVFCPFCGDGVLKSGGLQAHIEVSLRIIHILALLQCTE